jgi:hypothetical protein
VEFFERFPPVVAYPPGEQLNYSGNGMTLAAHVVVASVFTSPLSFFRLSSSLRSVFTGISSGIACRRDACDEFSGVVEQIGSDVAPCAPGDAVFGNTTGMGAYAEYDTSR